MQTQYMSTPDVDEFLAHYGVRGMRWGHRRERTKVDIQRDMDRIPDSALTGGYGLRGHYAQKKFNKIKKKNPKFDYDRLSPQEQRQYDAEIRRRTYVGLVGRGFVEAALVGGAAAIGMNHPSVSQFDRETIATVGMFLGGAIGIGRAQQIRAVRGSYRLDELREEFQNS